MVTPAKDPPDQEEVMRMLRRARFHLAPWGGWLGGGLGWALTHQLGSDLVQDRCGAANPLLMILIGLTGLVIAGFGGATSLRAWRQSTGGRRFVARVGALFALLFSVAIFLQTAATVFLPRCFG